MMLSIDKRIQPLIPRNPCGPGEKQVTIFPDGRGPVETMTLAGPDHL